MIMHYSGKIMIIHEQSIRKPVCQLEVAVKVVADLDENPVHSYF